jgi:hypothetical protein
MNTLETHVLELVGEDITSPDVFTDTSTGMAQIRDSINDAIEEIAMITGGQKRNYYLPLEADKGFYRFRWTEDVFAWITDAWLVGQKRRLEQTDLIRLQNFNPRWMQNTGTPSAYFPIGIDVVGIWPRTTSDTDLIEFSCVVIPDRYENDDDRIKLRDSHHWAAVHYAVGEYWASRGDAKSAIYHHNKYLEKLGVYGLYPEAAEYSGGYQTQKAPWPKSTD